MGRHLFLVAFPRDVDTSLGRRAHVALGDLDTFWSFAPTARRFITGAEFGSMAALLAFRSDALHAGEVMPRLGGKDLVFVRVSLLGVDEGEDLVFSGAHAVVCGLRAPIGRERSLLELSMSPILSWSRRIMTLVYVRKELLALVAQGGCRSCLVFPIVPWLTHRRFSLHARRRLLSHGPNLALTSHG